MLTSQIVSSGQTLRIPSVHVHGPRSAQLEQLDSALRQLRAIRRAIAAGPPRASTQQSARDWWGAGIAFAVMLGLLTLWAWAVRFDFRSSAARPAAVVHETF